MHYRSTNFDKTALNRQNNAKKCAATPFRVDAHFLRSLGKPKFCEQFLHAYLSGQRFIADRFGILFKQFFLLVHFYHREYIVLAKGRKVKSQKWRCVSISQIAKESAAPGAEAALLINLVTLQSFGAEAKWLAGFL